MNLVRRYLSFIKFEHTVFALPFALIALLVAAEGRPAPRLWRPSSSSPTGRGPVP